MFFTRENDSGNRNRDHLSESVLELNDEEDEDGSCSELKSGESELESRSEEDHVEEFQFGWNEDSVDLEFKTGHMKYETSLTKTFNF